MTTAQHAPRRDLLGLGIRIAAGLLFVVTVVFFVVTQATHYALPAMVEGLRPVHCRIVWTKHPQTAATIAWSTREAGSRHRVLLDTRPHAGRLAEYALEVPCRENGAYADPQDAVADVYYHHAFVDGLTPATTYWFVLASDDDVSREFHFVTAPAKDWPFAVLAGGDSIDANAARRAIDRRIAALTDEYPDILALAFDGDFVRHSDRLGEWIDWLTDHELTTSASGRVLPIIPARGNHDVDSELFDQVFASPGAAKRNWYAMSLSPAVEWLTLDTEAAAGGDQAAFIEATLKDSADARFRVVQYHRPMWPAVRKASHAKPIWVPLFERFGVDLALECDGHALKRTVPIRNGAVDPNGVVYVGEGGLGSKQRTPQLDRWWIAPPGHAESADHVWLLRFGAEAIELRAIRPDGTVADRATIRARRRAG